MRLAIITLATLFTFVAGLSAQVLNEIRHNQSGTDSDYIEIFGSPGSSVAGLSILVVSAEFEPGQVDFRFDLAGNFDAQGAFLLGNPNIGDFHTGVVPDKTEEFGLFGSPTSYFLVNTSVLDSNSIMGGTDLDTNNDGTFETSFSFLDAIGVADGDDNLDIFPSFLSGNTLPGDGNFTYGHFYRITDGLDTDSASDWVLGSFSDLSMDTPGVAIPEPSFFALVAGLALGLCVWRRRRS